MNSKKQCSVMLDLLPLYQEGLLRPETEQTVSAHLQECADCRRAYEELRNDKLPGVPEADRHAENLKQAAPLRKFRFHLWMNILGAPLWLPLLLTAVLVILAVLAALFSALVALWCVPLTGFVVSLASIPVIIRSAFAGLYQNIVFFIGVSLACAGFSILCFWLCKKLSVLFFRAMKWLVQKIGSLFRRCSGKKATKEGDTVQ